MPKKQVIDPITDQEITFARLVLSGTMTDRCAAGAAGLNPDTATYTKSKPRVRAYMLEHRAAVNEQFVDQDADLSRLSRLAVDLAAQRAEDQQRRVEQARDRILARLWEIADLDSEKTRGNMSSQIKALSLIATIEGVTPDARAASAQKKPAHPPVTADIYRAAWLGKKQQDIDSPSSPIGHEAAPGSAGPTPPLSPTIDLTESADLPGHSSPPEAPSLAPRVPGADFVPPSTVRRPLRMGAWKLGR